MERNRATPDHISAKHEDLPALINGLAAFDDGPSKALDAVVAAAVLAFGFVYIHPLEDGNGGIHRYLMHHVLSQRGFAPRADLSRFRSYPRHIDEYRKVLED